MSLALERLADPDELAVAAAAHIAQRALECLADHERFSLALSGGVTPRAMLARLATLEVAWERVDLFQVDERVAPRGDPERNLTDLVAALGATGATIHAMPVDDADLAAAAARYATGLPSSLDLVHLGLGPDGHVASLVPGDPVLDVSDRAVALCAPYHGRKRMTLTYPGLARAASVLWLVEGAAKRDVLARLRRGDRSIPAGRVATDHALVMADEAALA